MTYERYIEIQRFFRYLDAELPSLGFMLPRPGSPETYGEPSKRPIPSDITLSGNAMREVLFDLLDELRAHRKSLELAREYIGPMISDEAWRKITSRTFKGSLLHTIRGTTPLPGAS